MLSYVYGKNVGLSLIASEKTIIKIYISESVFSGQWQALIKKNKIDYEIVSKKKLDELSENANHQGIVFAIEQFVTYNLDELVKAVPKNELGLIVILDGIQDPHNLGAILRNCDGAKAHGVVIGKNRSASLNATVAKVSTGAIDTVKVAEVTNLVNTIKELKQLGYWIVGCETEGEDLYSYKFDTPIALVIGSESKGISQLVKKNCDYLVSIPMRGKVTSLNASVAAAIIMYQIQHQRNKC